MCYTENRSEVRRNFMDFKTYLKEKREELGYSQNKLAKALQITQPYYN